MDKEVIMPAGTYYIGDPCYYVPRSLWSTLLENCSYFEDAVGEINGHKVLGLFTEFGDGRYKGSDGRLYDVDSGTIGLTPAALVEKKNRVKKYLITFSKDVVCTRKGGLITIGNIKIQTGYEKEENDY